MTTIDPLGQFIYDTMFTRGGTAAYEPLPTAQPYYQDDHVTLYHGDCLDIDAWLKADVLICDPPYGMAFRSRQRCNWERFERIKGDDSLAARDAMLELWPADKPAAVFGTWKQPRPNRRIHARIVWDKTDGSSPGMGDILSVFGSSDEEIYILGKRWPLKGAELKRLGSVIRTRYSPSELTDRIGHPTPKPVGLMEILINAAPPGVIADPFAGSGSTLLAARNLRRRAIGVEINERYCELTAKRLAQMAFNFTPHVDDFPIDVEEALF